MSDKTPDILIPALRQYQHNDCSGLFAGFDYDETVKIVSALQQSFIDQACEIASDLDVPLGFSRHEITAFNKGVDALQQAIRDRLK